MTANVLLAVSLASPLIFAAVLWLTRAGAPRTRAAIVACLVAAVLSLGSDTLAVKLDWWAYPHGNDLLVTLALSVSGAFLFGGAAGLIGWRMMRAMGWTGAMTFLAGFVGLGLLRDHTLQANTDLFAFGVGPMPLLMASVGYLSLALAVQVTMLIMAGRPHRDALRSEP